MHEISYSESSQNRETFYKIPYGDVPGEAAGEWVTLEGRQRTITHSIGMRKIGANCTTGLLCPLNLACGAVLALLCYYPYVCCYCNSEQQKEKGLEESGAGAPCPQRMGFVTDERPPDNRRELCCLFLTPSPFCDLPDDDYYYLTKEERIEWTKVATRKSEIIVKRALASRLGTFDKLMPPAMMELILEYVNHKRLTIWKGIPSGRVIFF
ncbi:MAG TPA: hypothetical protein VGJ00_06230 [Rhabdochlamydiaceae bacterium]